MGLNKVAMHLVLALTATMAFAETAPVPAADNTGLNKRDETPGSRTLQPTDQAKGTSRDVELTRRIRETLMKDETLSTNAHNVKIVTLRGITTLRGPVNSAVERERVSDIASQVLGGAKFVRDQLDVKAAKQFVKE